MTSPRENLQNLLKIGQLKAEPPDQTEFDGLVKSARRMLPDARNPANASESRFILAYDATRFLALAALRWHGYRSENRYIVFQVLVHTLSIDAGKWRFLADCHQKRNVALYDGDYLEDEQRITELIAIADEMQTAVDALGLIGTAPSPPSPQGLC